MNAKSSIPRHKNFTKYFRELTFEEQAKSITATINNLQRAIYFHVSNSKNSAATKDKCAQQIHRFLGRVMNSA